MEGQLTIFDWQAMKEDIRRKLQETAENFVYIGYKLRQIEKTESYKNDGASSIYEFAQNEYGLTRTVTQRFMAINAKFSVGGNSTELLEEYRGFGSSKLQEMLNLPDGDCELLTEKATVKEIRELKTFNRQQGAAPEETEGQEAPAYTNLQKCIIDFFSGREKKETLNEVMKMALENGQTEETVRQQAELINPSEFASHAKGLVYLFLYEYDRGVSYKSIANSTITKMTWKEFVAEITGIYGSSYGSDTWLNFYGPVEETADGEKEPEKPENTESDGCATSHNGEALEEDTNGETEEWKEDEESPETGTPEAVDVESVQDKNTIDGEPEKQYENEAEGQKPHEGTITENPYYKLQEEAAATAETVAHLLKLHKHILIEDTEMKRIKGGIGKLSALVEQMEQFGSEAQCDGQINLETFLAEAVQEVEQ